MESHFLPLTKQAPPRRTIEESYTGTVNSFVVALPVHQPVRLETLMAMAPQKEAEQDSAARFAAILLGLSEVAHELRHSLALIRGSSQLLMELDNTGDNRYYASVVNEEAVHLGRIMEDLLDLSRLELGQFKIVPTHMDLAAVTREAVAKASLLTQKHTIAVRLPAAIPPVSADCTRINQVLTNLLSNAIKYSPEGGAITVTAQVLPERRVGISVGDEGPGIPEDLLYQLFQPFCRGNDPLAQAKGVGLGLAISKGIIQAHGGQIWVESFLGNGCTFTFSLPYASESLVDQSLHARM